MDSNAHLLMVSFDAVGSQDIDLLLTLPNFSPLCRRGTLVRDVSSVFVSNTYPTHTTIQTGDGPATFIMQIAGFLVGFSALFVEIKFHPPMWVHLIVWLPLVVVLSLALMRPGRGLMIGLQYRNQT